MTVRVSWRGKRCAKYERQWGSTTPKKLLGHFRFLGRSLRRVLAYSSPIKWNMCLRRNIGCANVSPRRNNKVFWLQRHIHSVHVSFHRNSRYSFSSSCAARLLALEPLATLLERHSRILDVRTRLTAARDVFQQITKKVTGQRTSGFLFQQALLFSLLLLTLPILLTGGLWLRPLRLTFAARK